MLKVVVLVDGAVSLGYKKALVKGKDEVFSKEDCIKYADVLNKLQMSKVVKLVPVEPEVKEQTPEELEAALVSKEEKKKAIKAKMAELEAEYADADATRQVHIKSEVKALKKEYKAL